MTKNRTTTTTTRPLSWLLGVLLFVACVALARSSEAQTDKDSLRGLPGLEVWVHDLDAGAEADGIRKVNIQTDVELQFRLAGIKVLAAEVNTHPARPTVYVQVSTKPVMQSTANGPAVTTGLYAVTTEISVIQNVTLWSGLKHIGAVTWSTESFGNIYAPNLRSMVRDSIKDDINTLINDWLTVNPK